MENSDLAKIFEQIKEKKIKDFKNFYFNQTYSHIIPRFNNIMKTPNY